MVPNLICTDYIFYFIWTKVFKLSNIWPNNNNILNAHSASVIDVDICLDIDSAERKMENILSTHFQPRNCKVRRMPMDLQNTYQSLSIEYSIQIISFGTMFPIMFVLHGIVS